MSAKGPELFFGLVAAVGTDLELVITFLSEALEAVDYSPKPSIRLASLLRELPPYSQLPDFSASLDVYINEHMTAGDELRQTTGRNDAMALLGIGEVQ
jgi:hypothetical protein